MPRVSKSDGAVERPAGKAGSNPQTPAAQLIELPPSLSVRELADLLHLTAVDIIKQLMRTGLMANINQIIDYKTAALVASGFGFEPRLKPEPARRLPSAKGAKAQLPGEELGHLKVRPPVVTVMGHVDHGKTKLLDAIRQTNVAASEVGGITQHIGAYQVEVNGQLITFIDTPGHEAFTAMRARGAQVTDITILVVAADDGVMPQTLEALDHARAAGVPIIVVLNKIDKPEANPDKVKQQLADAGLIIEEWGGDVICVETSAKEKRGITELLENILVLAEVEELKANPVLPAEGIVIEAKMDRTKGPLATVLIQSGTLRPSDIIVVGNTWGRVKAMFNDMGKRIRKAEPAMPVEVLGLENVPQVGDQLTAVATESRARTLLQKRLEKEGATTAAPKAVSLASLSQQIAEGKVKELNVVVKTDVQGSIEPIRTSLEQLSTDEVKIKILRSGTGNVTESDVMLAAASKGIVIGFGVSTEMGARRLAQSQGVDINNYRVIYEMMDDIARALKGLKAPVFTEVIDGRAEVRAVFPASHKRKVAGLYVTEGKITRNSLVRVVRKKEKLIDSEEIISMKRFKDDIREAAAGYEAGVILKGFDGFEVGDILEFYRIEKVS